MAEFRLTETAFLILWYQLCACRNKRTWSIRNINFKYGAVGLNSDTDKARKSARTQSV